MNRSWVFTINNSTFDDLVRLHEPSYKYCIFGFETGEQGTPHIQGYFTLQRAQSINYLNRFFPRAYLEVAKGTAQDNYDYCSKSGDFYEFGELPQPGRRTDIDSLVTMISSGATREDIKEAYPKYYFMYKKKIEEMVPVTINKLERKLILIPYSDRFIEGAFIDQDLETYTQEDKIVLSVYHLFDVEAWMKGFPPRIRRGYEIILIDPRIVYITYDSPKELSFLKKKYIDIIDDIKEETKQAF